MSSAIGSKVVLVTGATSPLGTSIARALGRDGVSVVLEAGDPETGKTSARALARDIVRTGGQAVAAAHNLSTPEGATAAVDHTVETFGSIDGLVTCPRLHRERSLQRVEETLWSSLLTHHLSSTFFAMQATARWLTEAGRSGRLVAITGTAGVIAPEFGQVHLAGVMGGVCAQARAIAAELRRKRITVNAIAPTLVDGKSQSPSLQFQIEGVVPLVQFLLDPRAVEVTGQVITVRGQTLAVVRGVSSPGVVLTEGSWTADEISSRWTELSR